MERLVTLNILPATSAHQTPYTGRDFIAGTPPSGVYRGHGPCLDNVLIIWDQPHGHGFTISKGLMEDTSLDDPKKCGCKYVRIGSLASLAITADPNS